MPHGLCGYRDSRLLSRDYQGFKESMGCEEHKVFVKDVNMLPDMQNSQVATKWQIQIAV